VSKKEKKEGFGKELSGAVARLPGVAGGKAEVTGSSAEDRKCREQHKGATGGVGGAVGQKGPWVGNH